MNLHGHYRLGQYQHRIFDAQYKATELQRPGEYMGRINILRGWRRIATEKSDLGR
jgi:hypothetical protein